MSKILYDSGAMSVDGNRARHVIHLTKTGIGVTYDSLYTEEPRYTSYYRDYPILPTDWSQVVNDYGTTAAEVFLHVLEHYQPYRKTYR